MIQAFIALLLGLTFTCAFAVIPDDVHLAHVVLMRSCSGCGENQPMGEVLIKTPQPNPLAYQHVINLMRENNLNPRESMQSINQLIAKGILTVDRTQLPLGKVHLSQDFVLDFSVEDITPSNNTSIPFGLSIIIPTYNNLSGTIACVSRLVGLIKAPKDTWEIIVVDDGCPNEDGKWLQDMLFGHSPYAPNCRVVWSDKIPGTYRNVGWPRNSGARAAKFSYLAFCDSDRFHIMDPVTPTLTAFNDTPESMIMGQNMTVVSSDQSLAINHESCATIDESFAFPPGWFAVPRAAFFDIGGYDQRFNCWAPEDSDIIKRFRYFGLKPLVLQNSVYLEAKESNIKHREPTPMWHALYYVCKTDDSILRNKGQSWGVVYLDQPFPQDVAHLKARH